MTDLSTQLGANPHAAGYPASHGAPVQPAAATSEAQAAQPAEVRQVPRKKTWQNTNAEKPSWNERAVGPVTVPAPFVPIFAA